jgi:RimJ/RimL family protein N-acetyltransferase
MSNDLTDWTPPPFPPRQTLAGQWCRLEPLSAAQHGASLWKHMAGAAAVWEFLAQPAPHKEADYLMILQAMEGRTDIVPFAVIDTADGLAKGHLWIMEIRPQHGVFEVGSITYSPALQRTRVASEAIYLIGRYGFELGYRRYEWKCNNRNEPSKRAALRFGFTLEGLFRNHMVIKGLSRDTAWYSIIESEWPARKARFEAWLAPENFGEDDRQKLSLSNMPVDLAAG